MHGTASLGTTRGLHATANEQPKRSAIVYFATANQVVVTAIRILTALRVLADFAASRPASTVKRLAKQRLSRPAKRRAAGQCCAIAAKCFAAKRPGPANVRAIDRVPAPGHAAATNFVEQRPARSTKDCRAGRARQLAGDHPGTATGRPIEPVATTRATPTGICPQEAVAGVAFTERLVRK